MVEVGLYVIKMVKLGLDVVCNGGKSTKAFCLEVYLSLLPSYFVLFKLSLPRV